MSMVLSLFVFVLFCLKSVLQIHFSKMPPKKVGKKGLVIRSQGRKIIYNVCEFMMKEAKDGISIPLSSHRERTLAATKISSCIYQKSRKEAENDRNNPSTSFALPRKGKPQTLKELDLITPEQLQFIREIIYDFYILEKRRPTLTLIQHKIREKEILTEPISVTSLSVLLKKLGFRWRKTNDNGKALLEKYDIRIKRIKYLKEISRYRNEGRNIIYTDETSIHSSQIKEKGSFDESVKRIRKRISKRQRLIIVYEKNGLLIFRSGTESADNRDEVNHQNFVKWVETQLLPNMTPHSVLVVNNTSYYNVLAEKNITSANRKNEMIEWLKDRNIVVDETLTKPEIYQIIQENKCRFPMKYRLDELLEKHGHYVLRLPPYHPYLNPVEKIWTTIKNLVTRRDNPFKLPKVEALTRQTFTQITEQEWTNICQHVKKHELALVEKEHLFETTFDSLKFTVNTGSPEESEVDSVSDGSSDSSLECKFFSDS